MSKEFRADIHCHTNCSDGSDTPLELLQYAAQADLQGLSITDHDTTDAYTPEFFCKAQEYGIAILPGVEISSELHGVSVHILGYGYDLDDPGLKNFLQQIQYKRAERNRAILKLLQAQNICITEEELQSFAQHRTIGRPHIAQLMMDKGYVLNIREAFEKYLKEGSCCYVSGIRFHPEEVIGEIKKAGGKAVLAHPCFIKKGAFLRELLDLPFDGIECHYARLDKALEKPWLKIAKKRNWIATGGSDYHGSFKPHIPLGCSWVSEHIFNELQSRAKKELDCD